MRQQLELGFVPTFTGMMGPKGTGTPRAILPPAQVSFKDRFIRSFGPTAWFGSSMLFKVLRMGPKYHASRQALRGLLGIRSIAPQTFIFAVVSTKDKEKREKEKKKKRGGGSQGKEERKKRKEEIWMIK